MNDLHRRRNIRSLVAIVIIIIAAVAAFFAGYYLLGFMDDDRAGEEITVETGSPGDILQSAEPETPAESGETQESVSAEAEQEEPSLTIDTISVIFDDEYQERDIKAVPVNTGAEEITFKIENEDIASVNPTSDTPSENGNWCTVTSKAEGTTVLTITCGDFSKTVEITCYYAEKRKAQAEADAAAEAAAIAEQVQQAAEELAGTVQDDGETSTTDGTEPDTSQQ